MAPTLAQAKRRKWWIAGTAVIENLMFAAVLLGWSSLLLMLKDEGFYSTLCIEDSENANSSIINATLAPESSYEENITAEFSLFKYPTCDAQDEILNRYFSIGSCLLSGVTIVLGIVMDRYGSRVMRLCGCLTFIVSCVFFAVASLDTEKYSFLMAPAVCLNGMGGVVYVFTSFQVPNLFENIRSTMISLMIGSYSASAIVYMLFKVAYDAGLSFQGIMLIHGSIGMLTFINCYFNIPTEPLPAPDDISYAIKFKFQAMRFDHKISGKRFYNHTTAVGRRMSNADVAPLESIYDISLGTTREEIPSFFRTLIMTGVLWSFATMCLTQLRLIAYMGWLEISLKASSDQNGFNEIQQAETVEFYTFLFGLLQINCFFMAPIIGTVMDWKLKNYDVAEDDKNNNEIEIKKEFKDNKEDSKPKECNGINKTSANIKKQKPKMSRKRQIVRNMVYAFLITNTLLVFFGIIILFESCLPLQVVAFILHTAIRTFLHSSMGGLYACLYHFSHFGKLTGLASFLSAMFILIQDPLFVWINASFGGDPFWVNIGLLVLSLAGFGLPTYLWWYQKSIDGKEEISDRPLEPIKEVDEENLNNMSGSKLLHNHHLDIDEQAMHLSISAITF